MKGSKSGDFLKVISSFFADEEANKKLKEEYYKVMEAHLEAWRPDLLLYNGLLLEPVRKYNRKRDLPSILVGYQTHAHSPSNFNTPVFLNHFRADPGMPNMQKHLMVCLHLFQGFHEYHHKEVKGGKSVEQMMEEADVPEDNWFDGFGIDEKPVWQWGFWSENFIQKYPDFPERLKILGAPNFSAKEQEEWANKGNTFFASNEEDVQKCSEFIEAGELPVYLGWGSMAPRPASEMAVIAVEALMLSGQRGIIVGGWGKVTAEDLSTVPNSDQLQEYAAKNVLFVSTAPHSWLFPQCSICVHHGGMGTTQVALQSGTPVIITPVLADQFDVAQHVTENKYGRVAPYLANISSKALSKLILEVLADDEIKACVERLASEMSKEDACGNIVDAIEAYDRDEVKTGKFGREYAAWKEVREKLYREHVKMSTPRAVAWFTSAAKEKSPPLREYAQFQQAVFARSAALVPKGTLWYVKASSCLAREKESIKSKEVGRFREACFVEQIGGKGTRLHVKRVLGVGPEEGWVTTVLSKENLEVLVQVKDVMEIMTVQQKDIEKQIQF